MFRLRRIAQITAPILAFALLACFGGVKKTGKVVDYKPGRVITKKGFYEVGDLPASWYRIKLDIAAINFRNDEFKSTLSTDTFCDQAFDDTPLNALTRHLFAGLQEVKIEKETPFMMNDRGALRTSLKASLDGVPVRIETVVIKKDWCLFDFYLVSPPENFSSALPDFEKFYQGFQFTGEI